MQIELDESAYSRKFKEILYSWDRYIIAYGGRGSGKTDTFYLKYLLSLFEPYYFKLLYVNKEGSNIRDQQYSGFKRVAKRIGLYDLLKFYDGDYRIVNQTNGNSLIPKGLDDKEKTKGIDDVTAIWWDEINKGDLEDFTALNNLLRTPQAKYLQFAMSFNPISEEHWLRKTFFSKEDRHELTPEYKGKALLNRSTYKDNEYINQKEYLETLVKGAAGNQNILRVNRDGDWGVEENNSPWLYAYDEDKHVKPVKYLPQYPVYLSFDFNNDPFTCVAVQFSPNKGQPDSFIRIFKEFSGKYKLHEMCDRIKAEFPAAILFVTGDSSGKHQSLSSNQTYYDLIQGYLNLSPRQMNLLSSNLPHNDSRVFLNAMFYNYPNIYIDPSCKKLREDCHIATTNDKSKKPGELKKDRDKYKMDLFDGMRYFFQAYFHDFAVKTYFKAINKK